ncbi:MAG: transporter substrate-binding domain-containing protein [Desulfamplus sp.]|nr:transporter substrate-binding domain-containing protein [Desulfamplus sp.]
MKKSYIIIFTALALLFLLYQSDCNAGQKIRVGVYNFKPLVFIDENGNASGFFPDILNYIAEKEGWEITYIHGSWSECLSRVETGEVDIQTAIAYSEKRDEMLDFSEYLIMDWSSVFKQKGSSIQTIFDLKDKKVSVVKSGITTDDFKRVIKQFGINCQIIEKNENVENLEAVHNREADAGISPNIYGTMVENSYNIERTPIVFSPIKLGFASKKDGNREILSVLNKYIIEMKADDESIYYHFRDKWTGGGGKEEMIPEWFFPVMLILLSLFIMLAVFNFMLKTQVKTKTSEFVAANKNLTLSKENYRILLEQAKEEIKERKLAEAALKESEEKFKVVFEQAPVGIIISDSKSVILNCNNHIVSIFGAKREQYYGMNLLEKLPDGAIKQNLASALADYELHQYEGPYTSVLSGKHLHLSILSKKISPDLIISILMDMTKHKEAEEENKKLQQQLLQAHKMESIGRLAGGVAHDFNNMLGVIIGHVELLLDKVDTTEPSYGGLAAIQKAATRSANLTKQLLAFARKQIVNLQVVNLNEAVEGMLSMLERLIGEDINLVWRCCESVGNIEIDPSQIDQIMVNLCVNAKDAITERSKDNAGKTGIINIETGKSLFDAAYCADHVEALPGRYLMLAVSDNGCGIDNERLTMIFDPFFTTKDIHKGTGLGLASVYGIVKQNNGFINVYSEQGEGTTFRVYLPEYYEDENGGDVSKYNIENPSKYNNGGSSEYLTEYALDGSLKKGKETVLLVEDELWLLELGETMLKRLGYTVLTANTPKEAVNIARTYPEQINLLLTDVIMPEMNGRDLAIQMITIRPELKCLFMSGYTANVIAHHGVLDEDVNFIQKPFSIQELSSKIRKSLQ